MGDGFMKIGYARVSTQDQNLNLQLDALSAYGCELIFKEKASGKNTERQELQKLLSRLRKGDTLIVWKLDRLGRSLKDLISLISDLSKMEVSFVSLKDGIDTATATGRFTFNIFGALAEFERDIISERTKAGLNAARARGRKGGRPPGLPPHKQAIAQAIQVKYHTERMDISVIAKVYKISKVTAYRYLKWSPAAKENNTNINDVF